MVNVLDVMNDAIAEGLPPSVQESAVSFETFVDQILIESKLIKIQR